MAALSGQDHSQPGRRRARQGAAGSERRARTARSEQDDAVSPLWIIPVLASLAGLAVAVALGRQVAAAGRDLGREVTRLGDLRPELTGLRDGVEALTASFARARRR